MFLVVFLFVSSILVDYQAEARTTGSVNVKIKGPVDQVTVTGVPPGGACNSSEQCIINALCRNQFCQCVKTYHVHEQQCRPGLSPGSACNSSVQCIFHAACHNQFCQCEYPYKRYQQLCIPAAIPLGELCDVNWQCPENAECSDDVFFYSCSCVDGYYEDLGKCVPVLPLGKSCNYSVQCIGSAICSQGRCICDKSYYKYQDRCFPIIPLGGSCNSSTRCIDNTICFHGVCKCDDDHYKYMQRCIKAKVPLGYSCENGWQCLNNDELSICLNGVCDCRNGYTPNGMGCKDKPEVRLYDPSQSSVLKTAMIIVGSVIIIAVMIMGYLHCKNVIRNYDPPSSMDETTRDAQNRLTRSSETLITTSHNEDHNTLSKHKDEPPSYEEAVGASNM